MRLTQLREGNLSQIVSPRRDKRAAQLDSRLQYGSSSYHLRKYSAHHSFGLTPVTDISDNLPNGLAGNLAN